MVHISQHLVGFIDSGWGGMTIRDTAIAHMPEMATVYIADHAYMPYGNQPAGLIHDRVMGMIRFLQALHVQLIVIACNTASVTGIDIYRAAFPHIPIIAVVPVIKTASEITKTHEYAIFATQNTVESPYLQALIDRFSPADHVLKIGSSTLASLIESGDLETQEVIKELTTMTASVSKQCDVIVLGCTHYPYIRQQIEQIMGPSRSVIDSSGAVARHIQRILETVPILHDDETVKHLVYTTVDPLKHEATLTKLSHRVQIVKLAKIP